MPSIQHASQLNSSRLRDAFAYWDRKRAGRAMPSRADIDPIEIPALLPFLMLIDVIAAPPDFRYRLIGTAICNISKADYTGRRFSQVSGKGPGSVVWGACAEVVRTRAPVSEAPPYVGPEKGLRGCENVLLPLSDDPTRVTMILKAVSFEVLRP
jgi:hypothetical protein